MALSVVAATAGGCGDLDFRERSLDVGFGEVFRELSLLLEGDEDEEISLNLLLT